MVGENLYYLKQDSFIQESALFSKSISFAEVPASISQISINDNGSMMIDTGSEISISASFDMIIPDSTIDPIAGWANELFPNNKKFFIPHKSGFMVKSGGNFNDFYRLSDNVGGLNVRLAQYNAYWQYTNIGGGFNRIVSQASLSNCTSHIISDDDVMICNDDIYILGDASNDIEHKNINYSGHYIFDLTIKAGNSLYFYSKNNIDVSADSFRLSKEDVINDITVTITEGYKIIPDCFDVNKGVTDTLNIGAFRVSDDVSVILKIENANTTPDIIETIGECSQIVSF